MTRNADDTIAAGSTVLTRAAMVLALVLAAWSGWSLVAGLQSRPELSGRIELIRQLRNLQAAMEALEQQGRESLQTRATDGEVERWNRLLSAYREKAEAVDTAHPELSEHADHLLHAFSSMRRALDMRRSLFFSGPRADERKLLEADYRATVSLAVLDVRQVIEGLSNTSAAKLAERQEWLMNRLVLICLLCILVAAILSLRELSMFRRKPGKPRPSEARAWTKLIEEASFDGVLTLDERAGIRSYNSAAEDVFGYSAKEIIGESLLYLIPQDSPRGRTVWDSENLDAAGATPQGCRLQVLGRRKDGTTFPLALRLLRFQEDHRLRYLAVVREQPEPSDRIRELGEECDVLNAVLEAAPAPMVVLGRDGRIVRFNQICTEITGRSLEEVRGRHFWDLSPEPALSESVKAMFADQGEEDFPAHVQQDWATTGGARMRIEWSLARLTDAGSEVEYVVGVGDLGTKQAESAETPTVNWAEKLAGRVSLSFNHLLTAINGYSDLLLSSMEPDAPSRTDVEEIRSAGERAALLSHQLQVFSRTQSPQPCPLDLNELIRGRGDWLRALLGGGVELIASFDSDRAMIEADPAQLKQVLEILAANARDAMPGGGKFGVRTSHVCRDSDQEFVLLEVGDSGCGMTAETRSHLFEPFFTTKPPGRGTGLGLVTMDGIVTQNGGSIEVDSVPEQGTTFRIYFPRLTEPAAEEPPPVQAQAASA